MADKQKKCRKNKGRGGRPQIKIPKTELENLAKIHCTIEELESYFGCCREVIHKRIREYYDLTYTEFMERFRGQGKISIRRKMFQKALGGSGYWPALKHLSENHLEMKEVHVHNIAGVPGAPVEVVSTVKIPALEAYQKLLEDS